MADSKSNRPPIEFSLGDNKRLDGTHDKVAGYDFNAGIDYEKLLDSYAYTGFQATNFGAAVREINKMIAKREEKMTEEAMKKAEENPIKRVRKNCTIFLGYTSNMISAGTRESIRYLVEHNMVDCLVTTAGGIEEDFVKCFEPTYLGDFELRGENLRKDGLNRIGNLLVPNENYKKFNEWLIPIVNQMLKEQVEDGVNWTPSKMIRRLGKEINDPSSVYYWCYKNDIPVFSPALTDGAIGDILFMKSFDDSRLKLDIIEDVRLMNSQPVYAANTGMIIVGGGLIKHHICNANLMRNGANYSVFINTAQPFDGSDAGATPDEAVSWGKIRTDCTPVKIYTEATLVLPLLIAKTFAKHHQSKKETSK